VGERMKLLYLWVGNCGNINNKGFKFHGDYKIDDSKYGFNIIDRTEEEITATKYKKIILEEKNNGKILFGENIVNITAIIGKNGSGKSNLLKNFFLDVDSNLYKYETIFVYEENGISYTNGKLRIENPYLPTPKFYKDNIELEERTFDSQENYHIIYYDNIFKEKIISKSAISKNFSDISTTKLYNVLKEKFWSDEIKKQASFVYSNEFKEFNNYMTENKMKIPTYIEINSIMSELISKNIQNELFRYFGDNKDGDKSIYSDEELYEILRFFIYLKLAESVLKETDKVEIKKLIEVLEEKLNCYRKEQKIKREEKESKKNDNKEYPNLKYPKFGKDKKELELLKNNFLFGEWHKRIELKINKEENEKLKKIIEVIEKFIFNEENFKIGFNSIKIKIDKYGDVEKIKEFIDELKNNIIEEHYLQYRWTELSTGEVALLALFSRFYDVKTELEDRKDILILMDEPDIFLHPEWQRRFLNVFIKFLEKVFYDKNIQIILTSHSPFIVSDLPKENIIFLNKDDNGRCIVEDVEGMPKTFASNVHTLFSKSFFMDSTIGEFARNKIKEVMKKIDTCSREELLEKENQEEIMGVINSIGEPILKKKLLEEYNQKINSLSDIEKIKIELEQTKKELENLKNRYEITIKK
jgi:predicted ATP-dependent endonuclease of OLD family